MPATFIDESVSGFELGPEGFVDGIEFSNHLGGVSSESGRKRTGNYSAKFACTTGTKTGIAWVGTPVSAGSFSLWRLYIYFDTMPTTDEVLTYKDAAAGGLGVAAGVAFHAATHKIRPFYYSGAAYSYGSDAEQGIVSGQWYLIDVKLEFTGTPLYNFIVDCRITADVQPDDVASAPQFTAGGNLTAAPDRLWHGNNVSNAGSNFTFYTDDFISGINWSQWATPYPIGPGAVILLKPTSAATGVNESYFDDSNGNSPPVNPHLLIDEYPLTLTLTDWFRGQSTVSTTSYIAVKMKMSGHPDLPNNLTWVHGGVIWTVHSVDTPDPFQFGSMAVAFDIPDTYTYTSALHSSNHETAGIHVLGGLIFNTFARDIGDPDPDNTGFFDAATYRFGHSDDNTPKHRWQNVLAQFAVVPIVTIPGGIGEDVPEPPPLRRAAWHVHPVTMRGD